MNEYDRHGYLLSRVGTTRLRRPLGAINSAASVPNGKPARLGAPPEVSNLPGNPAQRASPGRAFGNVPRSVGRAFVRSGSPLSERLARQLRLESWCPTPKT